MAEKSAKKQVLLLLNRKLTEATQNKDRQKLPPGQHYHPDFSDIFDIIEALAAVSTPAENESRYLKILDRWNLSALENNEERQDVDNFYTSLDELDRQSARHVLKAYLQKTHYRDLRSGHHLDEMSEALLHYGDAESARHTLEMMLEKPFREKTAYPDMTVTILGQPCPLADTNAEFRRAIARYLDRDSIPLLKKALQNSDDNIRAFALYHLIRLGVKLPREQITTFAHSAHWKIRFNALSAENPEDIHTALQDKHPAVRLLAHLLAEKP